MTVAATITYAVDEPGTLSRTVLTTVLVLAGLAIAIVARTGANGLLRRNRLAGVRTRRSLASDEAWRIVHRGAEPWFHGSGAALLVGGVWTAVTGDPGTWFRVVVGSAAVSAVLALLATWQGHRALDR